MRETLGKRQNVPNLLADPAEEDRRTVRARAAVARVAERVARSNDRMRRSDAALALSDEILQRPSRAVRRSDPKAANHAAMPGAIAPQPADGEPRRDQRPL